MNGKLLSLTLLLASAPLVADTISYTGVNGEQQYTITQSGIYQITAYGAQGGNGSCPPPCTLAGGEGAEIGGDFFLAANTTLDLYIGQQGVSGPDGGGGGGTFMVIDGSSSPLIVAGGGGGAGYGSGAGGPATTGNSGDSGGARALGGGGGGGGGYGGNGAHSGADLCNGGMGFPNLAGGCSNGGDDGGYGGGGGGDGSGGGGGGGYGGGNGADYGSGGTGGSSYLDATAANPILLAGNTGNGEVSIDYVGATVPEPASLALFAAGLAGLVLVLRRRKERA